MKEKIVLIEMRDAFESPYEEGLMLAACRFEKQVALPGKLRRVKKGMTGWMLMEVTEDLKVGVILAEGAACAQWTAVPVYLYEDDGVTHRTDEEGQPLMANVLTLVSELGQSDIQLKRQSMANDYFDSTTNDYAYEGEEEQEAEEEEEEPQPQAKRTRKR